MTNNNCSPTFIFFAIFLDFAITISLVCLYYCELHTLVLKCELFTRQSGISSEYVGKNNLFTSWRKGTANLCHCKYRFWLKLQTLHLFRAIARFPHLFNKQLLPNNSIEQKSVLVENNCLSSNNNLLDNNIPGLIERCLQFTAYLLRVMLCPF